MSYIFAERDGKLFAKETTISEWAPVSTTNWYQLATPWTNFITWFASEDAARKFLDGALYPTVNPPLVFENAYGWRFRRTTAGRAEHTESTPIPEPAQRGHKYSLVWHKGAWHKETAKGLVKFASAEVAR